MYYVGTSGARIGSWRRLNFSDNALAISAANLFQARAAGTRQ